MQTLAEGSDAAKILKNPALSSAAPFPLLRYSFYFYLISTFFGLNTRTTFTSFKGKTFHLVLSQIARV